MDLSILDSQFPLHRLPLLRPTFLAWQMWHKVRVQRAISTRQTIITMDITTITSVICPAVTAAPRLLNSNCYLPQSARLSRGQQPSFNPLSPNQCFARRREEAKMRIGPGFHLHCSRVSAGEAWQSLARGRASCKLRRRHPAPLLPKDSGSAYCGPPAPLGTPAIVCCCLAQTFHPENDGPVFLDKR